MVGAYGGSTVASGRSALLPAPAQTTQASKTPQRPQSRPANGAKDTDGTPVTVFIGE